MRGPAIMRAFESHATNAQVASRIARGWGAERVLDPAAIGDQTNGPFLPRCPGGLQFWEQADVARHQARALNAVDFWRGTALVMIFINHIPGNLISNVTLKNFAINDAAELFVFLAGWSISYASGKPNEPVAVGHVFYRFWDRAVTLYRAHLAITVLALALLAAAATFGRSPLLLGWHNAGPAFNMPVEATLGLVTLSYQVGFFNILPMYILLLFATPFMVLLGRWNLLALAFVSLTLYVVVLSTQLALPSWPVPGSWFFNPLSWQIYLVAGFIGAELVRSSERVRALFQKLVWPAAVVVIVGAVIVLNRWYPDPTLVPEPRLFFIFQKTYSTPARALNLLALVIAFAPVFALIQPYIGPAAAWFCKLGRNSLAVFCIGSLLSLVGQLVRYYSGGLFLVDLAFITAGLCVLGIVAWFVEANPPAQPSSRAQSQLQPSA